MPPQLHKRVGHLRVHGTVAVAGDHHHGGKIPVFPIIAHYIADPGSHFDELHGGKLLHRQMHRAAADTHFIGERINPTGKKRFKEALLAHDVDYILGQAVEQIHAGAEILDVNVGLPGIDEKEMMVTAVKAIQSVCDTPLQLDSTIPEVLEAGLRVYNGKPIVNSVNGEDESLDAILPLVKKYGASVVGLTLDKGGIPKTADGRFAEGAADFPSDAAARYQGKICGSTQNGNR